MNRAASAEFRHDKRTQYVVLHDFQSPKERKLACPCMCFNKSMRHLRGSGMGSGRGVPSVGVDGPLLPSSRNSQLSKLGTKAPVNISDEAWAG